MKKLIAGFAVVSLLGIAAPVYLPTVGSDGPILAQAYAKSKKKSNKKSEKEKNTDRRLKKLKEVGVPKSFFKFGDDLSLREMGTIMGAWIMQVFSETGQLPATITNNPPDWLMLNINGICISNPDTCDRWSED